MDANENPYHASSEPSETEPTAGSPWIRRFIWIQVTLAVLTGLGSSLPGAESLLILGLPSAAMSVLTPIFVLLLVFRQKRGWLLVLLSVGLSCIRHIAILPAIS